MYVYSSQKMALKMQTIRNIGVTVSSNPEESVDLNISKLIENANINIGVKYKLQMTKFKKDESCSCHYTSFSI